MTLWVIMASGQSLNDEDVAYVKEAHSANRCKAIAVSNVGIDKAPWADALVSHDRQWWKSYKEAFEFPGDKYCRNDLAETIKFNEPFLPQGCNSGLLAMYVASHIYKALTILLLGFDMHGTHYFGQHSHGLKNPDKVRFEQHKKQFTRFSGATVINCTSNSALQCFPKGNIRDYI